MPIFDRYHRTTDYSTFKLRLKREKPSYKFIDVPSMYPLLHTAVRYNNPQGARAVAHYFRKKYVDKKSESGNAFKDAIDYRDHLGKTALHHACELGYLFFTDFLMANNDALCTIADNEGNQPLHLAVKGAHFDTVEYLLSKHTLKMLMNFLAIGIRDNPEDLKVNALNNAGKTPLDIALKLKPRIDASEEDKLKFNNNKEQIILALLLQYNDALFLEDKRAKRYTNDNYLLIAIEEELSIEIITRIIQQDSSLINEYNAQGIVIKNDVPLINLQNGLRRTALHLAVEASNTALVILLLANKADILIPDFMGNTPLHLAAAKDPVDAEMIELLLADPVASGQVNARNVNNKTPLHLAATHCDGFIAKLFRDYGADVNASDNEGNTPIHIAAHSLNLVGVNINLSSLAGNNHQSYHFLEKYSDVSIKNNAGKTAGDIYQEYFPGNCSENPATDSLATSSVLDQSTTLFIADSSTRIVGGLGNGKLTPVNPLDLDRVQESSIATPAATGRSEASHLGSHFSSPRSEASAGGASNSAAVLSRRSTPREIPPKGRLEKLNDIRISLWRKFKQTIVGRFVRRHPYISAAILALTVTGAVALCVFVPPIAAHIAIIPLLSKVLSNISFIAKIVDPVAKTVAMLIPAVVVAGLTTIIKLGQLCYQKITSAPAPKKGSRLSIEIGRRAPEIAPSNTLSPPRAVVPVPTELVTEHQSPSASSSFNLLSCLCGGKRKDSSNRSATDPVSAAPQRTVGDPVWANVGGNPVVVANTGSVVELPAGSIRPS